MSRSFQRHGIFIAVALLGCLAVGPACSSDGSGGEESAADVALAPDAAASATDVAAGDVLARDGVGPSPPDSSDIAQPGDDTNAAADATPGDTQSDTGTDPPADAGDAKDVPACVCERNADCEDGDPCTDDWCDDCRCLQEDAPRTTPCTDGDACTENDRCSHGECAGGDALDCDDDRPCTADRCEPDRGCVNQNLPDGTPCPGASGETNDECWAGSCQCVSDCSGRECGSDGCNGSCGSCDAGEACSPAGSCGASAALHATAACRQIDNGWCLTWELWAYGESFVQLTLDEERAHCTSGGGTYAASCPGGSLGGCRHPAIEHPYGVYEWTHFYYAPGSGFTSQAQVRERCRQDNATFVSP